MRLQRAIKTPVPARHVSMVILGDLVRQHVVHFVFRVDANSQPGIVHTPVQTGISVTSVIKHVNQIAQEIRAIVLRGRVSTDAMMGNGVPTAIKRVTRTVPLAHVTKVTGFVAASVTRATMETHVMQTAALNAWLDAIRLADTVQAVVKRVDLVTFARFSAQLVAIV